MQIERVVSQIDSEAGQEFAGEQDQVFLPSHHDHNDPLAGVRILERTGDAARHALECVRVDGRLALGHLALSGRDVDRCQDVGDP